MIKKLIFSLAILATSLSAKADWLPREVHEVRAYVYDYTQEYDKDHQDRGMLNWDLLKDGRLHKGVINKDGAKLNKEQVERLMKAMKHNERTKAAKCHWPHHGFVFYDKEGVAMGHLQLCFQCSTKESSPHGAPVTNIDWDAMKKLFKELDVPVLKGNEDYTKLYQESVNKG